MNDISAMRGSPSFPVVTQQGDRVKGGVSDESIDCY